MSWYVQHNEKEFTERVREASDHQQEQTVKECRKKITKVQKRHKELDGLVKKLYENNATGKIPDKHFTQLLAEYDEEQTGLEASIVEWQRQIESWNADYYGIHLIPIFLIHLSECNYQNPVPK